LFAPESPWHLVRHNRLEDAEKSLRRLQRQSANIDVKETLATIVYTNNLEEELSVGTSYWDCFTGFELRRTEIACMCFAGQVLSGSSFAYNSTYFFEQVGLATSITYKLNLGGTGLALFGTLINWSILMPYFGRRTVYTIGMGVMCLTLMLIGILNHWTEQHSVGLAQAVLTLFWTFCFQLSAGQLGWALPAEMGSTRLRQKTVCLARNAYYVTSVISGVLEPYLMNPQAWNLKGYTGFIWGGTALLTTIWAYFRLPETKGRPYEELDILFAKKVSARDFKKTSVDAFDEQDTAQLAARYSVADLEMRRPSVIPSVSKRLSKTGRDEAYASQRRASVLDTGSRRPSIAAAVTEYLGRDDRV
jgi:MFS transporter, SP family, general alpha glucoside:H+ symporter